MPALNILLVEDSEADIMLTQKALSSTKLRSDMTIARSGLEATRACASPATPYDVLLLDIGLPDVDGLDALDEMKALQWDPNTVVIALTGNRDPGFVHTARDRGVHALLNKPLLMDELIQVLLQNGYVIEMVRD